MFEEVKENPVRYIKSIAMDLVVVIVSFAYIFYQMITLEKTDLNPLILIAESIIGIICGIVIKQALGENGFSKGYNSQTWKEEEEKYNASCNAAIDYVERVDNFYISIEKERKEYYRRNKLQSVRLKYSNWFDKEGNYIGVDFKSDDFKKLTFRQKIVISKCIRVRIYVLNLFSQYENTSEQDTRKESTDRTQRNKNLTKNTLSATLVAMIGVYFLPVINGWNWASFISSTLQVSLWVLFGVLQLYTNFNYVVQERVSILKRKKELIQRFIKDCEKGLYKESIYKEEKQVVSEKENDIQ